MKATAWNNGNTSQPGGYGIKVSRLDRDRYFCRCWRYVCIELPDGDAVQVGVSWCFWRKCISLRHRCIGAWLMAGGKGAPWHGKPPTFELVPKGAGRFVLR